MSEPREEITVVRTASGSTYTIIEREEKFFLRAENVPNPSSQKIEGEWEIVQPVEWPPVLGHRLLIDTPYFFEYDNPLRLPGGGKRTSAVVEIITTKLDFLPGHPLTEKQVIKTLLAEDNLGFYDNGEPR